MLELLFLVQNAPIDNQNAMASMPPSAQEAPTSRADWQRESPQPLTNPALLSVPNVDKIDPSAPLFMQSNMCVVVAGQPLPDCAKPNNNGKETQLVLNEEVFSTSSLNEDATCQTIETVRADANGKPVKVFASLCGDAVNRNDYREIATPYGSSAPSRPTQRSFGPTNISPVPAN